VLLAVASTGEGVAEIADGVDRHFEWMRQSGQLDERRRRRLVLRTQEVVRRAVDRWVWRDTPVQGLIDERLDDMVAGRASPYDVAADVVAGLKEGVRA
jgi:LAO/AO transport system kinase